MKDKIRVGLLFFVIVGIIVGVSALGVILDEPEEIVAGHTGL